MLRSYLSSSIGVRIKGSEKLINQGLHPMSSYGSPLIRKNWEIINYFQCSITINTNRIYNKNIKTLERI